MYIHIYIYRTKHLTYTYFHTYSRRRWNTQRHINACEYKTPYTHIHKYAYTYTRTHLFHAIYN